MKLKEQGKVFLNGLIVVLPLLVTAWLVVAGVVWIDQTVRSGIFIAVRTVLPDADPDAIRGAILPGVGVLISIFLTYLVGLLAGSWILRWPLRQAEMVVNRIPLIKSLYSATKDLLQFLGGTRAESRGKPCVVRSDDGALKLLGLVTQEAPEQFMPGEEEDERVAVYVPMSYQIGGYTLFVPQRNVERIEGMSVEQLLKLCMTAGIGEHQAQRPRPDRAIPGEEKSETEGD